MTFNIELFISINLISVPLLLQIVALFLPNTLQIRGKSSIFVTRQIFYKILKGYSLKTDNALQVDSVSHLCNNPNSL